MKIKIKKLNNGFTIIETMIAVSLFIVIVMAGMGAFLNANLLHDKSRNIRSIVDNLSFIMEDIGRNLRTGYNYHCFENNFSTIPSTPSDIMSTPNSCPTGDGWAISFESQNGVLYDDPPTNSIYHNSDQWAYKVDSPDGINFNISKSTDGGSTWVQLNPPEVLLDGNSGFSVVGAEPPSTGDKQQPFVTIKLIGKITYKGVDTPFSLQTSVSQRALDI